MQIDRGCLYGIVAKQLADGIKIVALIKEMSSETVAEGMKAALFG